MGLYRRRPSTLRVASTLVIAAGFLAALAVLSLQALSAQVTVGVLPLLLGPTSGLLGVGLAHLGSHIFTVHRFPTPKKLPPAVTEYVRALPRGLAPQ
jgi:hypothetical protein